MTSPRTLLGPLTTTWTPPPICSYAMAVCDTCTTVWYGQTCKPDVNARDFTDCWPPRSGVQASSDPGVMMGWGFYSPGIACPAGYTTAAVATAGGSSGWPVEYFLTDGETAAACCPSGYGITTISATDTIAQTCVMTASSSSFISVQCHSGIFTNYSTISIPATVSGVVLSQYIMLAPLVQINFQASDRPLSQTTTGGGPSSTPPGASSGQTTAVPGPTSTAPGGADGSGGSSANGLSSGAKIGVGVGAAIGAVLLIIIALLMWRLRRRDRPHKAEEGRTGIAGQFDAKKEKLGGVPPDAELAGTEVKELDGRPVHSELPTHRPSHKHPAGAGPVFRPSDQNWALPADGLDGLPHPMEPHHGAVFELEGDSTPRSGRSTFEAARH